MFSYAFVDKVTPIQKRQLQTQLKEFLATLTPSRKLDGKQFAWQRLVAILQLWQTCGLMNRVDVLQSMCKIPQGATMASELASFKDGLDKAERHGQPQPLTRDELDVVLRSFAANVTKISELAELLNWSGFVERPPSAMPVLTNHLNRLAGACDGSATLQRLTDELSARLDWGLSHFEPIAARRVLGFNVAEILNWLKSSAYARLKTPSAAKIIAGLQSPRPDGANLLSHLHLLEYVQANLDMEGVPKIAEVITRLLERYCDAAGDHACCELVAAWSMPLIAEHEEIAVNVMKTALSHLFPRSSPQWNDQKSRFAKAFCQVDDSSSLAPFCICRLPSLAAGPVAPAACAGGLEARAEGASL